MFTKTLVAATALAVSASAQGLSSCWSECFAKYQISSEGQLCCSETGPIVSSCIAVGCPTANATAYTAWLGEYCWINEGGSTSATSNTWTAPPSTSTVYSTSAVTITSCAPDVYDCPAESSTEVIVSTTSVAVSTTEVCPYVIPTPSKPAGPGGYPPAGPSTTATYATSTAGTPTGGYGSATTPAGPTGGYGTTTLATSPAGPVGGYGTSSAVGGGYPGAPAPSYPAGNATVPAMGTGSGYYPPQQTGNGAGSVKVGGVVMLLGAAAALL